MPVILIDENIPLLAETLEKCGDIYFFTGRKLSNENLIKSNCEILFVRSTTKVNKQLLENTRVKYVASTTSGVDHISVNYLKKNKITFAYAPGSNSNSVAEYLIFCLLKWACENKIALDNQCIGVIGFGNIGSKVARYCNLLGLKVVVNDPPLRDKGFVFPDYVEYAELKDIFKNCTIITNHVPLTSRGKYPTKYMINKKLLNLMQNNVLFFHLSRGGVVSEKDLLAVADKKNLYLVIDVWENEPHINTDLLKRANFATPHIAGYSYEGKIRGVYMVAKHFCNFYEYQCNFTQLEKELSKYNPLPENIYNCKKILYSFLKYNRALEDDSFAFKELLLYDDQERAYYFDLLRRNYPIRRETL